MSGIVLKISIMDTHPPVWRRVVVPEKISFFDLHRIIQVLFDRGDAKRHVFEAPRKAYRIAEAAEDAQGVCFLETQTRLDWVFAREKWVSYTCLFDEEWRCKLLFEKKLPEEQLTAAKVLKAKGTAFAENSGDAQSVPEVYDVEQVNQKLEVMQLEQMRTFAAEKQKLDAVYAKKEREKKFIEQVKTVLEPEKGLSPIEKEAQAWERFCGESLTGTVCVKPGTQTSRELLRRLSELQAAAYCKYLQLLSKPQTQEQMLDAISEELEAHPEYYLYLLEPEEVAELKRLTSAEPEKVLTVSSDAIQKGLMLGLLQIELSAAAKTACILPAVDLSEKLTAFQSCKGYVRQLTDVAAKMRKLLYVYIALEVDAFYELFEKQWEMGLSKRDFLRYVYWYGTMGQNFDTYFTQNDDVCYVSIADLNIAQVHAGRQLFAKDLSYKPYDRKFFLTDLDEMTVYEDGWSEFASILCAIFALDEDELTDVMQQFFEMVLSGDSMYDMYGALTELSGQKKQELLVIDHVNLWLAFLNLLLSTPLPMLNGYSRLEYEQVTGEAAFDTGIFSSDEQPTAPAPETSLFALSAEWQTALAQAYFSNTGTDVIKAIEKIRKELSVENYEVDAFLACCCLNIGKESKGISILNKLNARISDESIEAFLYSLEESLLDECAAEDQLEQPVSEMPYRRETPKIGRNDPCPCGSGKKYKKCCGR